MNTDATYCPFCNAVLPPLATPPTLERLACPRCGELVPADRWRVEAATPSPPAPLPGGEGRKPANHKTAGIMVGIMCAMAALSLGYALWTTKERQARHPWMPKKLEPIALRRPLELAALGYLPKDCKLVAAIHVGETWDDEKLGRKLLADPRPGLLDWPLKRITRTSGLTLEEIDHVVLGLTDLSQMVMIVKTRLKIAQEKIADARPVRSSVHQDRPLYEFTLAPAGAAVLWCVEDDVLVYVLRMDTPRVEHLNGIPGKPRPIDDALPAVLRAAIRERIPTQDFAWAVGRIDQFGPLNAFLPFVLGPQADVGSLKELKIVTFSVAPANGVTLLGNFQMTSATSAAAWKARLEGVSIQSASDQKVEATPNDAPDAWVTWQVRGDMPTLRDLLDRGKSRKK